MRSSGEVGEVVTDAELHVLAEVPIDRGQRAGAGIVRFVHGQAPPFEHEVPFADEVQIPANHEQIHRARIPVAARTGVPDLAHAARVLASDG